MVVQLTVMFQQCFLLLQVGQSVQDDPAHTVQIGNLVVNVTDLTTCHVLTNTQHLELVHHRGLVFLQIVQRLRCAGSVFRILQKLPAPRYPPSVLPTFFGQVREARFEALEEGVGIIALGNVR